MSLIKIIAIPENSQTAAWIKAELERKGYGVSIVGAGEEIVQLLMKERPDVTLFPEAKSQSLGHGIKCWALIAWTEDGRGLATVIEAALNGSDTAALKNLQKEVEERKRIEDTLRLSECRYRFLVDNLNEAILVVKDGRVAFFNSKAPEVFGWPSSVFDNMPIEHLIYPDDKQIILDRYHRRIKGEDVPQNYDVRATTRREIYDGCGLMPSGRLGRVRQQPWSSWLTSLTANILKKCSGTARPVIENS